MDSLHERLARLALSVSSRYGFCLAGGYAVQAHGVLDRHSEDVDLFTTSAAEEQFPDAVATVIAAYKGDGLDVSTTAANRGFARLPVIDPTTLFTAKVELGIDWRQHQPVTLAIGPYCIPMTPSRTRSAPSSPGPKHATTSMSTPSFNPADIQATSYSPSPSPHDPGFDVAVFVIALRAIHRLPPAEFAPYGLTVGDASALTARMTQWADTIGC